MKVYWKEKLLFELSDLQKRVFMDSKSCKDMGACNADLERRVNYLAKEAQALPECTDELIEKYIFKGIDEVYKECLKRMKHKWEQKLAARGIKSLPTDSDEFAQLVFSQEDYKDRATRDAESEL